MSDQIGIAMALFCLLAQVVLKIVQLCGHCRFDFFVDLHGPFIQLVAH